MTDYIVDSNIVAKWLLPEPHSDRARALMGPAYKLRAPDLLMPELASTLWKRASRGELTVDESHELLRKFLRDHIEVTVRLLPSRLVAAQALRIAASERHSIYDCLYLALAVQARCRLITADDRFMKSIQSKTLKAHVVSLNDPELGLEMRIEN